MWSICSTRKTTANQHQHETCTHAHTHTHLTLANHASSDIVHRMFSCNAFDTHRHPQTDDALHKHSLCPWQMHIVLWKQTMWTETTETYYVFLLRLAWMYVLSTLGSNNNVRKYVYPMWTPTDRIVQSQSKDIQINTETMINDKSGKNESNLSFQKIICTFGNKFIHS